MPSCVFIRCHNHSRTKNKIHGITYHRFPPDPRMRAKWIKIVQTDRREDDWLPNAHTRICSAHFNEDEILSSKLGRRRIKSTAIPYPTLVAKYASVTVKTENSEPGSPLNDADVSDTDSIFDSPMVIHLKKELIKEKTRRLLCRRNMLKLKRQTKYLKSQVVTLREKVKSLKSEKCKCLIGNVDEVNEANE